MIRLKESRINFEEPKSFFIKKAVQFRNDQKSSIKYF